MRKKYNTPHRSRVVKTRLSEDEYADFTARLAPYGISQSEFLRQAIRRRKAGFGEGTPQQVSREGQNRRIADFGTVVETCSP